MNKLFCRTFRAGLIAMLAGMWVPAAAAGTPPSSGITSAIL